MAYIVKSLVAWTDWTVSTTLNYPEWFTEQQTWDYIAVFMTTDVVNSTIITSLAGWTEIYKSSNTLAVAGIKSGIWYIKNTGSAIASPTLTISVADEISAVALLIRDADGTNFLDVTASITEQTTNTQTPQCPSVTTTTNDCLLLHFLGFDSSWTSRPQIPFSELVAWQRTDTFLSASPNCESVVYYTIKHAVWATSTFDLYRSVSDGGVLATLAIRNASGGAIPVYPVSTPLEYIEPLHTTPTLALLSNLHPSPATLLWLECALGTTAWGSATWVITQQNTTSLSLGIYWYSRLLWQQQTANTGLWNKTYWCAIILTTPVDFTTSLFVTQAFSSSASTIRNDGSAFYFRDSSWNYALWQPLNEIQLTTLTPFIAYLPSQTMVESGGTIDWSNITHIGTATPITGTASSISNRGIAIYCLCTLSMTGGVADPIIICWGSETEPISLRKFYESIQDGYIKLLTNIQGSRQTVTCLPVQIGDGITPTYFNGDVGATEFFRSTTNVIRPEDWQLQFRIKASATDVVNFGSMILGSSNNHKFTIDPTTNLSATYNVRWVISWFNVSLPFGTPWAIFVWCSQIEWEGLGFHGCIFSESIWTSGLVANTTTDLTNCTLENNTNGVELTTAGTYNFDWVTFSWNTNDVYVSATTGTVTINLSAGAPTPTHTTDGATVVFTQPQSWYILTFPNILTGSRIQVYDVTTGIELTNEIISGTFSESYTELVDYVAGDIGRYRITYVSGATAKQEIEWLFIFSAGNNTNSNPITQEDCVVYNTNAIDGSAITQFSADYTFNEIDIDVWNNFSIKELYAWWKYNLTTASGIRDFFGGITSIDTANYQVNTATVSIYIDNTTTSHIYQTDNVRFFRDDNAYPVKLPTSGGGSVDVEWRRTVQVDGIEPQQIASAVWNAVALSYNTTGTMGELENDIVDIDTNIDTLNTNINTIDTNLDSVKTVVDTNLDIKVSEAGASETSIHDALDSYTNKDDWKADVDPLSTQIDQSFTTLIASNGNILNNTSAIEYAVRQMRKFLEEKWEEYMLEVVNHITGNGKTSLEAVLSGFTNIDSTLSTIPRHEPINPLEIASKINIPKIDAEEIAKVIIWQLEEKELKEILKYISEHEDKKLDNFVKYLLLDIDLETEIKNILNK